MSIIEIEEMAVARRPMVPPTPPRAPDDLSPLGRMALMRRSAIETWGPKAYRDAVIKGRFFGHASFVLNDPDAIRHVLVDNHDNYTRTPAAFRVLRPMLGDGLLTAEGRAWKHQRRTLAPAFTPRAVGGLVPHMLSAIDETVAELHGKAAGPVDLREIMQRMTLEIAGRTMFSTGMARHGKALRGFVLDYSTRLARPHLFDLALPRGWPVPHDLSRYLFRRRWTRFIAGLVAERRAAGKAIGAPPRDLFELMLQARDPETGAAFSDDQLGDQVATMILAGHETTATALFWALYLLTLDPAAQEQVATEAGAAMAAGAPELDRLPFTRAVIEETMRLYPPAFLIARAARDADTLCGMAVAKGDVVLIAPWLLHRHETMWTQPEAFMPERFMPGAPPPDRFAYLPFGVGARVCIGAHFAMVEATLALARLIGAFRVTLPEHDAVMPVGVVTTQPNRSPKFRIDPR